MNALKLYYRTLTRNKVFTSISIGGFSLSLAVVVLLLSFIRSEKQYDRSIPEVDQIYQILSNDHSAYIPEQTRDKLLSEFPQVSAAPKVMFGNSPVLYKEQNTDLRVVHTDSGFFRVFSLPVVSGQRDALFRDPNQAGLVDLYSGGPDGPVGDHTNRKLAKLAGSPEKSCRSTAL